ncbi:TonB-dependent receptor [Mucilaginibacter defluvii]
MTRFAFLVTVITIALSGVLLAADVKSQDLRTIQVTFSAKNTTLEDVFNKIEQQTALSFTFAKQIGDKQLTTYQATNRSVDVILKELAKSWRLKFVQLGDIIAVSELPPPAKPGRITGKVTDAKTGETLIGVTVRVSGRPNGASTDVNGRFSLQVEPGTYNVALSYVGYQTTAVNDVVVKEDQPTYLAIKMEPSQGDLAEVTVKADRVITSTNEKLVGQMKNAVGVVSGISSEQITISVDRSASEVVRRVAGITLQDGFISIRGMTPRYNPVFLNNVYMPSTDPNKRAFNFDLLPSNVIDRILVYKTGAPELPGDFAGGVVKVHTKKSVNIRRFEMTLNGQYRTGNKFFSNHVSAGNGKYDWLGFDDGTRGLPKGIPRNQYGVALSQVSVSNPNGYSIANEKLTDALLQRSAKQWTLQNVYHPMDIQGDATYYTYANLGSMKLNSVSLARYELQRGYFRSNTARGANQFVETDFPANGAPLSPYYKDNYRLMYDSVYSENVRLAAMQDLSLNIDKRNDINLMVLFNHMAKDQLQIQTTTNWNNSAGNPFPRRVESAYNQQQLLTTVLGGTHKTNNDRHSIEWNVNYSRARSYDPGQFSNIYEPDLKSINGIYNGEGSLNITDATTWRMYTFPQNTNVGNFSDGEGLEKRWQGNIDYVFQIAPKTWKDLQLKAGAYYENRNKNYQFYAFRYGRYPAMPYSADPWNTIGQTLLEANALRPQGQRMFTALQTTGNAGTETQGYKAKAITTAGYAALNIPLRFNIGSRQLQWDIYAGTRLEYTDRLVLSPDGKKTADGGAFSMVGQAPPYTYYWLPSVNTTLHISPKLQWRMAYYKTVNRAEFRELSPFITYNPADGFTYQGYSGLQDAKIDNFDARLEWYPSEGETITGGAYFKNIKNPIEDLNAGLFSVGGFMPGNLSYARIYGAEIEVRKKLDFMEGSLFRHMGVILNAAYNQTKADNRVSQNPALPLNYYPGGTSRPLQAASPWIINAGLFYDNKPKGSRISVQYNAYGDRLLANTGHSLDDDPALFDRTRHLLDVSILQKITNRLSVRVAAQNLLNSPIRHYVDGDFDRKFGAAPRRVTLESYRYQGALLEYRSFIQGDYYVKDYRPGVYYTVGFQLSL